MSREWDEARPPGSDGRSGFRVPIAASKSPGLDGLRSHEAFHRRGHFDVTIKLHDGRDFSVVRQGQGLAQRRRSLYDRLRAIAECCYTRRPDSLSR